LAFFGIGKKLFKASLDMTCKGAVIGILSNKFRIKHSGGGPPENNFKEVVITGLSNTSDANPFYFIYAAQ